MEAPQGQRRRCLGKQRNVAELGAASNSSDDRKDEDSCTKRDVDKISSNHVEVGVEEGQGITEEVDDVTSLRPRQVRRKHLCQYYTRGSCKHGTECRYVHDDDAQADHKRKRNSTVDECR